ncbi:YgjV family protein [Mesorhizobium sp. AR10]|uniref:YgjV family protein n=1 Tax=Mesorhizobium sp. AR10 TaxID=2865839 RepID=UPI00215F3641|nr:YgjV family protein [Mesorhizobium sp. AR10]UVK37856.1 YgjV family protein [Mesorhizobium sp. AR10]
MAAWIEAIGFLGSFFTVLTYSMKQMFWLRVAALMSCLAFMAYGTLIGSLPLILMELMLLPINAWRLMELSRPRLPSTQD